MAKEAKVKRITTKHGESFPKLFGTKIKSQHVPFDVSTGTLISNVCESIIGMGKNAYLYIERHNNTLSKHYRGPATAACRPPTLADPS